MLAGSSENENRPHSTAPTVDEFLSDISDVDDPVRRFQKDQRDYYGYDLPIDIAFVRKLAYVGKDYIASVMQGYPGMTMAQFNNLRPEHRVPVTKSVAAVIFGIAYEAMDDFLTYPDRNGPSEYIFDSSHFFTLFDNFMSGTGLEHKDAFDLKDTYTDTYTPAVWGHLANEAKENGLASLFGHAKSYLLPQSVRDLTAGLYSNPYVAPLSITFAEVLPHVETEDEQQQRIDRISQYAPAPEEQTPEQIERDKNLRRLLGITSDESTFDPELDTPDISDPEKDWNKITWWNKLFGETNE